MAGSSIYDLKKGFLSSQLRILNTPLDPPRDWQEQIPEGEDGDLPEATVAQVLYKCWMTRPVSIFPVSVLPYLSAGDFLFCDYKGLILKPWLTIRGFLVNVVAKRHQKLVYSAQALRHVAEQIDDLYWKKSDNIEGLTREDDVLRRGVDLKDPL